MALGALLKRLSPPRPPDRVGEDALQAIAGEPAAAAPAAASPSGQRREIELILARKVLEAHLQNRRQLMQTDPGDLRSVEQDDARLLIQAMTAAAHADGGLDARERARIRRALASTRLNDAERAELEDDMNEPPCLEALLRRVANEETATRFYAVSLAATERGPGANKSYLNYLASRLNLPRDVTLRLNRAFDVPV